MDPQIAGALADLLRTISLAVTVVLVLFVMYACG
jgi:hypothetical protein